MMPNASHKQQHRRNQQQHHPRSLHKLRHHDHHHRDPCSERLQPIHKNAVLSCPSRSRPQPMSHHPRLRQCEGQKRSHRKQRNQPVGDSAKQNQQQPRENRQCPDPLRINQAPSPRRQRVRKIIVPSHHPAQPWKIRERSIRRKTKHQQNREHGHIVKNPSSCNRRGHHRQHTLIPRLPRDRSRNSVIPDQHRNSSQQHYQNRNDRRQSGPSALHHRLPERLHSIADRFHARKRCAPGSKSLHQYPDPHRLQGRRRSACLSCQTRHRHRMPSRNHYLIKANR